MFSIKNVEYLQKLNESGPLESQVKATRLQSRLGGQNFREDMNKVLEPVTKSFKDVSGEVTKTKIENSLNNNKAIENSNEKILELMNDKVMIARYLASFLVTLFKPENESQFRLIKDLNSTKMNDFIIN